MASPYLNPSTLPLLERKIAPLPQRRRSRSNGAPSSSQSVPDSARTPSPSPVSEALRNSLLGVSYQSSDTELSTSQPSPLAPHIPRSDFQVGTNGNDALPVEEQENFTIRLLRNTTLAESSSQAKEEVPHSASEVSPEGPNYSTLPEVASFENCLPNPAQPTYSDEKIPVLNTIESVDQGIPAIVEEHSGLTEATPHTPPPSSPSAFRLGSPESNLSPTPHGLRQRSLSDVSEMSDVTDISINNDSNDSTGSYDVTDEEAPLEPFFTSIFQNALRDGLGIANKLVSAIEKLIGDETPSVDLERLLNDARKLETFQSSDTRTIAVLGDSGEGKSSLINALLHFPDIAKTGDIGSACTSVVTEYRQKTREHTSPITIEVEYLSEQEIEDLIKELLWNFRQIFLPEVEADTIDSKDYARFQRESLQAWSALEAGFGHQRGFNKHLLSNMAEGGLVTATNTLIEWARELQWPDGGNSGSWKATADTAEECCEKTSVFMQDKFWPFTKIIRVYLSSQVLKTGVVLADLPGLQDTNLARVRATQMYLMKCDNVFIVAKIARAITDQSLQSSLYSILARHAAVEWEESGMRSLNLAVVCTKSEDINQRAARREFCSPNNRISPLVMRQLDSEIEDAKKKNNKALKKQLKRRQENLLIGARNDHVKDGLQRAYSARVPGGQLEVFCVSNTAYEKYSRKGINEMVRASGIPELRRFCHTITADAQLREAKHFLQSTLSSLLSSVEVWASSSPPPAQVEDDQHDMSVQSVLEELTEDLRTIVETSRIDFKSTLREVLSTHLEQRNQFWEAAAEIKGREWQQWHWTQYNAWCMNSGNHYTLKRGSVNWNADLIWKMRMELDFQWNLLEEEIPTVFKAILESITDSFGQLQRNLREKGFAHVLVQGIDFRLQDIDYKFGLIRQKFVREVKLVRRYASEPNDSSYVVSEMIPAYRTAAAQSGTGKAARQRSIVQGRIDNGTLFPHISTKIQTRLDEVIKKIFDKLQDELSTILGLIVSDIDMALVTQPPSVDDPANQNSPEEEEQRAELVEEVKELKREHENILTCISDI